MKLYSLLFVNEAPITAEESISQEIGALLLPGNEILLIKPLVLLDIFNQYRSKNINELRQEIVEAIANQAIVGYALYEDTKRKNLFKILSLAAKNKFGPLLYQMVMYMVEPAWLASDVNLNQNSIPIWQKMYELSSDDGIYKRKFLGSLGLNYLVERIRNDESKQLEKYLEEIKSKTANGTENDFIAWLSKNMSSMNTSQFGYLWAYQMKSHNSKIEELFKKGNAVKRQISYITIPNLNSILSVAGSHFFSENLIGNS